MLPPQSGTFYNLQKPLAFRMEKQLSIWKEEISFYERLLGLCLLSCKEEHQSEIETLVAQFHIMGQVDLPALKEQLNQSFQPGYRETAGFRECFYAFDQNLDKLKSKIFRGFSHFGRVQIW